MKSSLIFALAFTLFGALASNTQKATLDKDVYSQITGSPRVAHYTQQDFNGDSQFWCMVQDDQGVMYFGNNDGLIIFDGERWQTVSLPNNSSVRGGLYSTNGKIYVAGFNEFGLINKDKFGNYHYNSFTNKLRKEDLSLENIWDIHEVKGLIIFRSYSKLIVIENDRVFIVPEKEIYFSEEVNGHLLLAHPDGLKIFNPKTAESKTLVNSVQYNGAIISGAVSNKDNNGIIVYAKTGESYLLNLETGKFSFINNYLTNDSGNQILSAIRSSNGNIYLGTLNTQIKILDSDGKSIFIRKNYLNLQDNTVLNLFESAEGNIWALLNNGIDCINISSSVSVLFENASVFDTKIHANRLYVATNQGVFVSQKIARTSQSLGLKFKKIPGLEGQAWGLDMVEDKLLCSHDKGLFLIDQEQTFPIERIQGIWKILPLQNAKDQYFVCTYLGIYLMSYSPKEGFNIKWKIKNFNESSRDIIQDTTNGVFWVCHGYKGVFRIKTNDSKSQVISVEHFNKNGLPSSFNINVFSWQNKVVFTTNGGCYLFNWEKKEFQPHQLLNDIFGTDKNVRQLIEYDQMTWFIHGNEVGYFKHDTKILQKNLFAELKGSFNKGMEYISPIDKNNVLIGTIRGLYAYDISLDKTEISEGTLLSHVKYADENGEHFLALSNPAPLSFHSRNIRFEFSAPKLKDRGKVQYSFTLENQDKDWSKWGSESYKEYSILYPGDYTFKIKARNAMGEKTKETTYSFKVLPAWYLTRVAYFGYALVFVFAAFYARKAVLKKIASEKEKIRKEEQKQQKVFELERNQEGLKNEKQQMKLDKSELEKDIIYKSKQLSNYAMLLVNKKGLLTELKDNLEKLKEIAKNQKNKDELKRLAKKIRWHLSNEEHALVFEANFERVHHEFFKRLKASFSNLTSKELKLCGLIKMNLTNKEIAPILNISSRGVETVRYRLRKKLGLEQGENMVEFLEKFAT